MKRILSLCLALILAAAPAALALSQGSGTSASTPLTNMTEGKLANITLAADSMAECFVPYGGYFSFNGIVGPRTSSCGYVAAPNGRGVSVIGGGVGQVATTVYLALTKLDGIEFDELRFYEKRFTDGYVNSGSDAVLVDYDAGVDFSFYNYAGDMTISVWVAQESVNCSISFDSSTLLWNTSKRLIGNSRIYVGDNEALRSNISLACGSIYDTTLGSGDTFYFNDIVGPRTSEYGYLSAVNGRGVNVVGGGVGQVASAVYLAVQGLDCITIVEKHAYGSRYNQSYVANGADAIVVDYSAQTDFSFRCVGENPLTIYAYLDGDGLICEIYEVIGG